jgi:type I restriction enzyme R subunit
MYIDLYNKFRKEEEGEKENINNDVIFEMELIKQVNINIDYILQFIKAYHEDHTKTERFCLILTKQ